MCMSEVDLIFNFSINLECQTVDIFMVLGILCWTDMLW